VQYSPVVRCGDGSVIENCQFVDIPGSCVGSYYHRNVTIRNCVFGPFSIQNITGILDLEYFNGVIENNVFAHIRSFWNFVEMKADSTFGATFSGNTFYDCKYAGTGSGGQLLHAYLAGEMPAQPYLVEHNVMAACTLGDWARGIFAEDQGVLTGNRLHNLVHSPQHAAPAIFTDTASNMLLRENLIYGNGIGLLTGTGQVVDAAWNWWGDSTGPYHVDQNPGGQGDTIIGDVDFIPWYPDTSFLSVPGIGKPLPREFIFEAYPNPFNSTVHLKLIPSAVQIVKVELFDLLGRKVKEIWSGPLAFQKDLTFDATALASGIYFARVTDVIDRKTMATAKLVLLK